MSRKIIISKKQNRLLNNMKEASENLPQHLLRDINYNNTSLSDWDFLNTPTGRMFLQNMTLDRYNEIKSYFKDDVSDITKEQVNNKLRETIEKCRKREDKIRPQVQKLCMDIVVDIFDLPENSFSLYCSLLSDIDKDRDFNTQPIPFGNRNSFPSLEDFNGNMGEITKRRLINCLSMGISMKICEECLNAYIQKLFELDEELPYLYSRFNKLNNLYLFKNDVRIRDKAHQQGGYVQVILGSNDSLPKIDANGILFPILLTETIKGFMELFASHGLPDDIDEAKRVIDVADALSNEPWDMRLGTVLCDKVFGKIDNVDSSVFPYFYSKLVRMNATDFIDVIKAAVCDIEDVSDYLNDVYQTAENEKEDYEADCELMDRQTDGDELITDQETWY